jgi:hypothetical protein
LSPLIAPVREMICAICLLVFLVGFVSIPLTVANLGRHIKSMCAFFSGFVWGFVSLARTYGLQVAGRAISSLCGAHRGQLWQQRHINPANIGVIGVFDLGSYFPCDLVNKYLNPNKALRWATAHLGMPKHSP